MFYAVRYFVFCLRARARVCVCVCALGCAVVCVREGGSEIFGCLAEEGDSLVYLWSCWCCALL